MQKAAIILVALLTVAVLAIGVPAQGQSQGPCRFNEDPGLFPRVVVTSTSGAQYSFRNITIEQVEEWDEWARVKVGNQIRIPYDTIVLIDARCA